MEAFINLENFSVKKLLSANLMVWIYFLLVTILIYKFLKSSKKVPPGPIGLPLLGYRPFLGEFPHKTMVKLTKKYGKLISLRFGPKLVVVANEYKVVKELLCHPSALDRPSDAFQHIPQSGFITQNGKEWEEQRRFSMQSMKNLGLGRSRSIEMIQEEVQDFTEQLKSYKGQSIELRQLLTTTVGNSILSNLIGRRLNSRTEEDWQLACNFLLSATSFFEAQSIFTRLPLLRKTFENLKIAGFDRVAKTIKDFSLFIRKEMENHELKSELKGVFDFINLYLEKINSMASSKNHYFSADNLEGNVTILFIAASDTIVTSLLWLFRLMTGYPEIQRRVQKEVDDHLGRDGKVCFEDRFKLPYTMAVLMEAQRFSAITPLIMRRTKQEIKIQGYTIPKGCRILANMWALHHDPDYWVEPEKFNPERFLNEDKKEVLTKLPSFTPFSFGKRNCPGETIAWIELLNYFTSIMRKFTVTTPPGQKVKFEVKGGNILRLKPQPLCFVERP